MIRTFSLFLLIGWNFNVLAWDFQMQCERFNKKESRKFEDFVLTFTLEAEEYQIYYLETSIKGLKLTGFLGFAYPENDFELYEDDQLQEDIGMFWKRPNPHGPTFQEWRIASAAMTNQENRRILRFTLVENKKSFAKSYKVMCKELNEAEAGKSRLIIEDRFFWSEWIAP